MTTPYLLLITDLKRQRAENERRKVPHNRRGGITNTRTLTIRKHRRHVHHDLTALAKAWTFR